MLFELGYLREAVNLNPLYDINDVVKELVVQGIHNPLQGGVVEVVNLLMGRSQRGKIQKR